MTNSEFCAWECVEILENLIFRVSCGGVCKNFGKFLTGILAGECVNIFENSFWGFLAGECVNIFAHFTYWVSRRGMCKIF